MTLQMIQEKYIGKRLNLYLIDGEDVTLDKIGTLTFRFQAEIFGDEALEVTNSLCEARLTLGEDHTIVDVAPLFCQQELGQREEWATGGEYVLDGESVTKAVFEDWQAENLVEEVTWYAPNGTVIPVGQ